jgi:NADH-quinone oxidoreductase subunit J
MASSLIVSGMSAARAPGSDRFGPRPQRACAVRSSVRPEAGRRQAQRPVMELLVFVVASMMVIGGAFGVIVYRHPVHAALSLVLTLFGVAVHFVAMEAHFLAAVQVIVYAGAIVVLFLFVIMLLGVDRAEQLRTDAIPIQRPLAAVMGVGLIGLLVAAIVSTRDTPPLTVGVGLDVAGAVTGGAPGSVPVDHDGNIRQLAHNLFSDNVFAFELTSVLLIVAVAGTVVMTRREKRRDDAGDPGGPS